MAAAERAVQELQAQAARDAEAAEAEEEGAAEGEKEARAEVEAEAVTEEETVDGPQKLASDADVERLRRKFGGEPGPSRCLIVHASSDRLTYYGSCVPRVRV